MTSAPPVMLGPFADDIWQQLAAGTSGLSALIQPYFATIRDFVIGLGVSVGSGLLEITLSVCAAFFFYRDGEKFVLTTRAVGGRIIAPTLMPDRRQALVVLEKTPRELRRSVLEGVHFVPLKSGIA